MPGHSSTSPSRSRAKLPTSDKHRKSVDESDRSADKVSSRSSSGSRGISTLPSACNMLRKDSGYESSSRRPSMSSRRRTSTISSSATTRPKTRPSIHRATRSGLSTPLTKPASRISTTSSSYHAPHLNNTYFHFPSPDYPSSSSSFDDSGPNDDYNPHYVYGWSDGRKQDDDDATAAATAESPSYTLPPQTTHYWTSDRTRRLEYAAIDAASQGVKGWMMRHVVPDCFVPKSQRRVCFDDDTGSVRRYRLELESEESTEKCEQENGKRKKVWLW